MKKLKSLLLTFDYPPVEGGISESLSKFWILANPPEGVVIAPGIEGAKNFDRNQPNRVSRFPCLSSRTPFAKIINFFSLGVTAVWYLLTHSIEYLHCGQMVRTGIFGYLRKLLTGRGYYLWVFGGETRTDFFNSRLVASLNKKILRSAEMVVTNSPFTSKEFVDYGLKVLEVVPGIDTKVFCPEKKSESLIDKYRLRDKKVLLTCGRLVERKGNDKVLEAMSRVLQEIPDAVYLIVGDGPDRGRLEDLTRQYGLKDHVHFVGLVDSSLLPDYYNLCDVFVMPNRAVGSAGSKTYSVEGFGMVFLEAAACGKPVIGGKSGGAVYSVDHGVNGYLVPPEDTDIIAEKIISLLKDKALYEEFSKNGLQHAKKFTWEKSAEKIKPYL